WTGGQINVNRGTQTTHWQHNPEHRRGGGYDSARVQQKFGNNSRAENRAQQDFRGRTGGAVLNPGGAPTNLGGHPAAGRADGGARPNVGEPPAAGGVNGGDGARGNPIRQAHLRSSRPSHSLHPRAAGSVHPVGAANPPTQRRSASVPRGIGFAAPGVGSQAGG